jgi:hypothetical protein
MRTFQKAFNDLVQQIGLAAKNELPATPKNSMQP